MKSNSLIRSVFVLLAFGLSLPPRSVLAQGSLTPPGAPTPTMKTLAQIEPRTPISSLPYLITASGSYYATTNLTGFGGGTNGINISSSDVTLDLNGFTLQGVPGSGKGIYVTGTFTNLVVRRGTVTGWGDNGVDSYSAAYPRNMVFEHLTISANGGKGLYTEADSVVRDCLFIGNNSAGIISVGGEITRCIARQNGGTGIDISNGTLRQCRSELNVGYGVSLNSSRALDCEVHYNSSAAFDRLGIADEIRSCRITFNQNTAVFFDVGNGGNKVADCLIANNTFYGIYTTGTGRSLITGNHLSMNGAGGIVMNDSNNHVENNHVVTANSVVGIEVTGGSYSNNVVVKNDVEGGGGSNYSSAAGNDFGPIGTAATATSPWANISH